LRYLSVAATVHAAHACFPADRPRGAQLRLSDIEDVTMDAKTGANIKAGKLTLGDKDWSFPLYDGTLGPQVIDISKLYGEAGVFTYDPGFTSTASCESKITFIDGAHFLFADRPIPLDDKARGVLSPEARGLLRDLEGELGAVEPWSSEATERAVRTFAERHGLKLGSIAQPLRAALTGRTTSPGIFEVLAVLGKGESLARVADQANKVERQQPRAG